MLNDGINWLIGLVLSASGAFLGVSPEIQQEIQNDTSAAVFVSSTPVDTPAEATISSYVTPSHIPSVPFYSQFNDVSAPKWQKLSCGIADLAMLIEFYKPGSASVDTLLAEGIASGAFIDGAGWSHRGLALLAETYGLKGETYDFSHLDREAAFAQLEKILKNGPVIASVYYTFTPGHPIPHLVVINGVDGDRVYYNDPSRARGGENISADTFKQAWKKRIISVRPI